MDHGGIKSCRLKERGDDLFVPHHSRADRGFRGDYANLAISVVLFRTERRSFCVGYDIGLHGRRPRFWRRDAG